MIWLAIWRILDFATVNHEPPNPEIPAVVCEYFQEDCVTALSISWCESLHNPRAFNAKTIDNGLFQISTYYWKESFSSQLWAQRFEVEASTKMAAYIVNNTRQGWQLWTCGR